MSILGYDIQGGSNADSGETVLGSKFTLTENATITEMQLYVYGTTTHSVAIYNASLNKVYDYGSFLTGAWGWLVFGSINQYLDAGVYWLCGVSETVTHMVYNAGTTNQGLYDVGNTSFPNPIVPGGYEDRKYSIFATYTPSGGGAPSVHGDGLFWSVYANK